MLSRLDACVACLAAALKGGWDLRRIIIITTIIIIINSTTFITTTTTTATNRPAFVLF